MIPIMSYIQSSMDRYVRRTGVPTETNKTPMGDTSAMHSTSSMQRATSTSYDADWPIIGNSPFDAFDDGLPLQPQQKQQLYRKGSVPKTRQVSSIQNKGPTPVVMKRSLSNASAAIGQPNKLQATDQHNADNTPSSSNAAGKPASQQLITGSVAQTVQWHRQYPQLNGLHETFGRVLRIVAGPAKQNNHRVVLLRDDPDSTGTSSGLGKPVVLPAHYYEIDFELPADVVAGVAVRCVGRFTACARFQVYKCRRVDGPGGPAEGRTTEAPPPQVIGGALMLRLASLTNYVLSDDRAGRKKSTKKVAVSNVRN